MTEFENCKSLAKSIALKFHNALTNQDNIIDQNFINRHYIEFPDIEKFGIENPIVVLGLNPSGGEALREINQSEKLLYHISDSFKNSNNCELIKKLNQSKLSYSPYFKTYVELFEQFEHFPVWTNKQYCLELIDEHNLANEEKELLLSFIKLSTNYLIFTDLICYAETNSKKVLGIIKARESLNENSFLTIQLKQYLQSLIEYIKPKIVLCANASVSHFISDNFDNDIKNNTNVKTHLKVLNTTFIFTSMLTGQRALDVFNRQRLINEIKQLL